MTSPYRFGEHDAPDPRGPRTAAALTALAVTLVAGGLGAVALSLRAMALAAVDQRGWHVSAAATWPGTITVAGALLLVATFVEAGMLALIGWAPSGTRARPAALVAASLTATMGLASIGNYFVGRHAARVSDVGGLEPFVRFEMRLVVGSACVMAIALTMAAVALERIARWGGRGTRGWLLGVSALLLGMQPGLQVIRFGAAFRAPPLEAGVIDALGGVLTLAASLTLAVLSLRAARAVRSGMPGNDDSADSSAYERARRGLDLHRLAVIGGAVYVGLLFAVRLRAIDSAAAPWIDLFGAVVALALAWALVRIAAASDRGLAWVLLAAAAFGCLAAHAVSELFGVHDADAYEMAPSFQRADLWLATVLSTVTGALLLAVALAREAAARARGLRIRAWVAAAFLAAVLLGGAYARARVGSLEGFDGALFGLLFVTVALAAYVLYLRTLAAASHYFEDR